MSLRHVSMHGVPQPYAARPSCITKINLGARCMIQHRIHRPGLAVHGRHRQEQQGPSCFTAAGAHRLRHRSLARRIAAGSSDSMTEEGPGSDIDLSQFVDLANELAEVAGSITKKFFRYSFGRHSLFRHERTEICRTPNVVQRLSRSFEK